MNRDSNITKIFRIGALVLWGLLIFAPLSVLFTQALLYGESRREYDEAFNYTIVMRSFILAAVIALISVILGYIPARLFGTAANNRKLLLLLLLAPLVLPRYVIYYALTLILNPSTQLGGWFSANGNYARLAGTVISLTALILWYWPLAALLISQGWRNIDRQIWDSVKMEGGGWLTFKAITLPLLGRSIFLAFGGCFVLVLSEFTTFHLSGIETIGTQYAVMYELYGSEIMVARSAWPSVLAALLVTWLMCGDARAWSADGPVLGESAGKTRKMDWATLLSLSAVSLFIPILLLLINIGSTVELKRFFTLHVYGLGWSLFISAAAATLALVIAWGVTEKSSGNNRISKIITYIKQGFVFLAMLAPGSVVAVSLLKIAAVCNIPTCVRDSWFIVSAGLAVRFTGAALIVIILSRSLRQRQLSESAALDGASGIQAFYHVHLPRLWPVIAGAFLMLVMFGMTETSATMVLLPAGLPNFAQQLLNQMHYARDRQVIASCLILIATFIVFASLVVLLFSVSTRRYAIILIFGVLLTVGGCDLDKSSGEVEVLSVFGRTGKGQCEFMYPRVIAMSPGGTIYVADKAGRIQQLSKDGEYIDVIRTPQIAAGKPVGMSFGLDGNLYVADTHYHRVLVFNPAGEIIDEFGEYGEGDGCFIYPTDVEFVQDGRIYVSEYGGHDRISVFNDKKEFLYSFGNGSGELSRPAGLAVDHNRELLYVADACNHRIAVYRYDGELVKYISGMGVAKGSLRYPYDLSLTAGGELVVCEFGNNRLQLFSPEGKSLAVYGVSGRQAGELAYPWAVTVDERRMYIVDSGNNRIQVWRL